MLTRSARHSASALAMRTRMAANSALRDMLGCAASRMLLPAAGLAALHPRVQRVQFQAPLLELLSGVFAQLASLLSGVFAQLALLAGGRRMLGFPQLAPTSLGYDPSGTILLLQ